MTKLESKALREIVAALRPLSVEDRALVLKAALIFLGLDRVPLDEVERKNQNALESLKTFNARAKKVFSR